MKHYPWTPKEDAYLFSYYAKDGAKVCATHMPHTVGAIRRRAEQLGVKRDRSVKHINLDLVKTPMFAYVLGFLWADGCLVKGKNGVVLGIRHDDGEWLKPMLAYTGTWSAYLHDRKGARPQWVFTVWDREFADLLRQLGYQTKSQRGFDIVCEYLGSELTTYFIHGFFDGDGHVAFTPNKRHRVVFTGAYDFDWAPLIQLLRDAGLTKIDMVQQTMKVGRSSRLTMSRKEDMLRFYRLFISHKDVIGLPRKRDAFEAFVDDVRASHTTKRRFYLTRNKQKYVASSMWSGKGKRVIYLGAYPTQEEAQYAVDEWEKVHRPDLTEKRFFIQRELDLLAIA